MSNVTAAANDSERNYGITQAFEGVQKLVLYNNPPYIKIIKRDRI